MQHYPIFFRKSLTIRDASQSCYHGDCAVAISLDTTLKNLRMVIFECTQNEGDVLLHRCGLIEREDNGLRMKQVFPRFTPNLYRTISNWTGEKDPYDRATVRAPLYKRSQGSVTRTTVSSQSSKYLQVSLSNPPDKMKVSFAAVFTQKPNFSNDYQRFSGDLFFRSNDGDGSGC